LKRKFVNTFFREYGLLLLAAVLFVFSLVFNTLYSNKTSVRREVRLLEKYLHQQQKDFSEFLKDTSLIRQLYEKKESLKEFDQVVAKKYGIFIISENSFGDADIKFWSNQVILPPDYTYSAGDGEYGERLANGYYLAVKKTVSFPDIKNRVLVYAMIPVESDFFIETDYLPLRFFYSRTAAKRVMISDAPTDFPVQSINGKNVFYLEKNLKTSGAVPYNDKLTIFLRLGAVVLLLLFFHFRAETVSGKYGAFKAVSLLFGFLLALRLAIYFFPSILNLRQFELFDPSIYGSNMVQRSLGDLLINAVFFCWVTLFAWYKLQQRENIVGKLPIRFRWVIGAFALCLLILSTFLLSTVIRSMVADSKISFDVTNFFSLNVYTVVGFVVLACLSFAYYYFTQLLFRLIFPLFAGRTLIVYFSIGAAGLTYLTFRSGDPTVLFYIPVLIWLLIYTWLVNWQGVLLNRFRINIAGILFWIFIFSGSISAIMLSENKKVEWEKRKVYAERLVEQTDPSSERLLSIALQYLDKSFLSDNFYRFLDNEKGKQFRDSIITENYRGYLNKYDTKLYVYDSSGRGINNDDPTTYEALNTILQQSKLTNIPDIYYYETSFDQFTYITKREVMNDEGQKIGSLFIISNPKKYSSDALFPELFKQLKQGEAENSPIYSYAIYNNKRLVSPSNKYPFATSITDDEVPKQEYEKRINGDYDELWYRASNDKVVVMARKRDTGIEAITLFSYIFCSFLFLVALVQLISSLLKNIYYRPGFKKLFQLNIRMQVHSTIIFISVFSFLVIGIVTLSFFKSRYNNNNNEKLSRTMKIMVNEMQKKQADHSTFDDVVKIYDTVSNFDLQKLVDEVSDIHDVDVNVYDIDGNLKVSSEANVYRKGVLSTKMNPIAFYHLSRLRQVQHSQEEQIADLSYLSIYAPVRDEDGNVYGYLNIPYFASQRELNQEISNFLVAIINLNAFIFLIAGVIALFITNRITRSFSIISEKMRVVNLGQKNEEIVWNREDEIGELVKEYNKMVAKLGESAAALAKSEREGAWREMARQVAHEIKNPLTPMKLSIQYLQKAIDNNQPNVKELSGNVANTLIEQIDHLSKIAADFSQFANIGIVNVELFDLHDVIGSLKDLYRSNPSVDINWQPVQDKVLLRADKTQMNRLFTNLFANALEACNGSDYCRIEVREEQQDGMVLVSVKDNGEGIPAEMQSKIFTPNFTTKSSGTGLGLAMCKGIVEQAKGKIWFETMLGKGTTFHVQLPVAE
jgi:two-component system nitrogen regulation sensor histidine kinase NtrY